MPEPHDPHGAARHWRPANAAARMTNSALAEGRLPEALAWARRAARAALLALDGDRSRTGPDDFAFLREMAALDGSAAAEERAEEARPLAQATVAALGRVAPPADGAPHDGAAVSLRGRRVLVVEDEPVVALMLREELRRAGAEVVGPAASLPAALRLVEAVAADGGLSAAVLDIDLHGAPVTPLADRLAALGVPFVFATGHSSGHAAGLHAAALVLEKPFRPCELVAALETLAPAPGG